MRRARIVAVVALLAVASVTAVAWWVRGESGPGSSPVTREDFRVFVEATGKLEAAVAYEIGPPSVRDFWDYNLSWMIREGKPVQKGDVIARFDATEFDDRLREHRATLETTLQEREKEERNLEVSLRQLNLELVKAEGELKTVNLDLSVPENLVSFIELEQTRLKQKLARQRVDFLREKIEFEKALVKSKLDLLDVKKEFAEGKIAYNEAVKEKFSVKAPISGMVIYVPKRDGNRYEVGERVWMLSKIMKVADTSTLRVEAAVLEADSAKIALGQPAEITVDAVPGMVLQSRIAEIGKIVHERSVQDPSKVFDALLPLEEVDNELLRPGMGVKVRIETKRLPGSLTIPLEAVRSSRDGTWVEVVRRDGRTERRAVTLGERNRRRVVVDSGLEEDEVVRLATPSRAS